MGGKGFHLARIAGIDVYLDWSLLIIFSLVLLSLGAGAFPAWHPDWSPLVVWGTALGTAVLFFASVLVHEFSHALVGRGFGIEVPRITLFVFGGMAQMREEPRAWKAELWMALAGPATSLVLGVGFTVLGWAIGGESWALLSTAPERAASMLSPLATLLLWLGPINIILGLFNLVPGFPLDGGRVLRAAIWGITGDLRQATLWASHAGQFVAWVLIAAGIAMAFGLSVPLFGTGFVSGLWLVLIGWFLNNAAIMSYRQLLLRETLEDVPVSKLMKTNVETVEPGTSVQTLVDEHLVRTDQRAYPVIDRGRLVGMVCLRDVHKLSRADWGATAIRTVMTAEDELASVGPDDSSLEAMRILGERGVNQLPVVDRGRVLGLVRREDILRWLSVYGDRRIQGSGREGSRA
jgi:Zn-dependent protease/predicted transcriptional regulator